MSSFSNIAEHMQTSQMMKTKPIVKFDFPGEKKKEFLRFPSLTPSISFLYPLQLFPPSPTSSIYLFISFHMSSFCLYTTYPYNTGVSQKENKDPR